MLLDQYSLLTAIGFSAAALCVTLLLSWASARSDSFLLTWAMAMVLIVGGVILFGLLEERYHPAVQCASFICLILGFVLVYAGSLEFCWGQPRWNRCAVVAAFALTPPVASFVLGLSGLATIFANISIATLLVIAGSQYWLDRREAPLPMTVNALLYAVTAFSFFLCCVPLIMQGDLALTTRPENWAEDINSIVAIIGLTGIGAVSLALNQSRIARRHQSAAMTDPLTGLLNRRALFEHLGTRKVEPGTAAFVLDLDHFKSINDRFGHACGDAVLRHFAGIMQERLANCDMVARIGGEEFCIVMPGTTPRLASRLAEDIRRSLSSEPVRTQGGDIAATVSIGIAICTGTPEHFEALLERADSAPYGAKSDGRNRVQTSSLLVVAA